MGREDLTYDFRDRLVSIDHHAVMQLDSGMSGERCCIAWFRAAADKAFTKDAQVALEA